MSKLRCTKCGNTWDCAQFRPICPNCLAQCWAASPGMIRPKHDPSNLPSASTSYRSVVPNELREHPEYYPAMTYSGTALYSNRHTGYCYVFGVPPYMVAGSAIPRGSAMPTHALNAFLVADPFGSNPHIYAEDETRIQLYILNSSYELLLPCSVDGCNIPRMPGKIFCAVHVTPPQAEEVKDE